MKTLLIILALNVALLGCSVAGDAVNNVKQSAIDEGKRTIANTAGVQCPVSDEALLQENATLKAEAVEKDKKITWLRKKAKDAGADLTK